jgi:hypothetical protein
MILYINYLSTFDENNFKIWLNHYMHTGLDFKIVVKDNDIVKFNETYPLNKEKAISFSPTQGVELTINDFLFMYDKDDNDNMIFNYNFEVGFLDKSICVGKVFYVPTENKPKFTTFEIPDFILYKHAHHTNYTIDGIKINGGKEISNDIVCLSLQESKVQDRRCYMEALCIYGNLVSQNIYPFFLRNIVVNKQHQYAVIWYPKSACTTVGSIFCKVNNIDLQSYNMKNLTYYRAKYRFNPYLQGLNFITFTRNPYHRFLSSFIDKHVLKEDLMYLNLDGYKTFLKNYKENSVSNMVYFINEKNYISDHYLPIYLFESFKYVRNKIKETDISIEKPHTISLCKIEDGMNKLLYTFLAKFHKEIDLDVLKVHDNSIMKKINVNDSLNKNDKNSFSMSNFQPDDWENYLKEENLNYDIILTDELKEKLYDFYKEDFDNFGYKK